MVKNSYSFKISGVMNIFTSNSLDNVMNEYKLSEYYSVNQIHSNIVHIVNDNYINSSSGDALITNK